MEPVGRSLGQYQDLMDVPLDQRLARLTNYSALLPKAPPFYTPKQKPLAILAVTISLIFLKAKHYRPSTLLAIGAAGIALALLVHAKFKEKIPTPEYAEQARQFQKCLDSTTEELTQLFQAAASAICQRLQNSTAPGGLEGVKRNTLPDFLNDYLSTSSYLFTLMGNPTRDSFRACYGHAKSIAQISAQDLWDSTSPHPMLSQPLAKLHNAACYLVKGHNHTDASPYLNLTFIDHQGNRCINALPWEFNEPEEYFR